MAMINHKCDVLNAMPIQKFAYHDVLQNVEDVKKYIMTAINHAAKVYPDNEKLCIYLNEITEKMTTIPRLVQCNAAASYRLGYTRSQLNQNNDMQHFPIPSQPLLPSILSTSAIMPSEQPQSGNALQCPFHVPTIKYVPTTQQSNLFSGYPQWSNGTVTMPIDHTGQYYYGQAMPYSTGSQLSGAYPPAGFQSIRLNKQFPNMQANSNQYPQNQMPIHLRGGSLASSYQQKQIQRSPSVLSAVSASILDSSGLSGKSSIAAPAKTVIWQEPEAADNGSQVAGSTYQITLQRPSLEKKK